MKSKKTKYSRTFLIVVFCFFGILFMFAFILYIGFLPLYQLEKIEHSTKEVISAAELQKWATNLLAKYPAGPRVSSSELRSNLPPQLKGLAPKMGPQIDLYHSEHPEIVSHVFLVWGSGFAGHKGFEIGPTNFLGNRSTNMWAPGVYFWDDNPNN